MNKYNFIILSTDKKYIEIFLKNKHQLKELNQKYIMGLISIDEFHDKLSTFLIDFIGNTINKEIFGYLNIESINRQLVNIASL